jgi:hypothetical protein
MSGLPRFDARRVMQAFALCFAVVLAAPPIKAHARDDRHGIEMERVANVERIKAISHETDTFVVALQDALRAIEDHNRLPKPDPRNHSAVEAYNREAHRLDANKDAVVEKLDALQSEQGKLVARNKEIDAALEAMGPIFTEAAGEFVKILNDVSQRLNLPKGPPTDRRLSSLNCQAFFRGVAAALASQHKSSWEKDFPGMNADAIAKKLEESASVGGNWEEISLGDAQELANKGAIVVGASQKDKSGYGHLGFVFPVPADIAAEEFHGSGPFVRDGNEHSLKTETGRRLALSTWGAVRASNAFAVSRTKWYAWVPSKQ